jgi:hypothetical protein
MDNRQFDDLARMVASIGWSRRRIIQHVAQGGIAALVAWRPDESAAKKKRKKKKKKKKPATPSCKPDCTGKGCGDFDGCAGTCTACPAGKTCQNNGCVDLACTPTCGGKVCGDLDGCGGTCTACPAGKTCQNNQCVDECRDEDCFGSRRCRNGVCACPEGLRDCDGRFWCGECCTTAECPGFPSPNGLQCGNEEAGSDILICRCPNGVHCGDGRCVQCCNSDFCVDQFGPGKFCNVNGGCQCPEGTQQCSFEQGCRDTKTDRFACGPNCIECPPGQLCENANCCFGLAIDCSMNLDGCCSGLGCVNIGTVFEPNFVCGVPL